MPSTKLGKKATKIINALERLVKAAQELQAEVKTLKEEGLDKE